MEFIVPDIREKTRGVLDGASCPPLKAFGQDMQIVIHDIERLQRLHRFDHIVRLLPDRPWPWRTMCSWRSWVRRPAYCA